MSENMAAAAEALRIEIFRQRRHLYEIAPAVGLHPARISEVLNGKRPLTPELAERIRAALSEVGA